MMYVRNIFYHLQNALAVGETQEMIKEARLTTFKLRVSSITGGM